MIIFKIRVYTHIHTYTHTHTEIHARAHARKHTHTQRKEPMYVVGESAHWHRDSGGGRLAAVHEQCHISLGSRLRPDRRYGQELKELLKD